MTNNIAKQARDELGLSTSEFARQLDISRVTVDQWIREIRQPPAIAVTAINQLLFIHHKKLYDEYKTHQQS
ncbi:helix-turn-helix transcriptional regulator [Proteus vulgaris]|uniref:helix-turn-helix domain-containing protein n=1 Tax=Proteus vulgaris TaxID=585 RepID=UPI002875D0DE|nr:helix-turn-helix transcriptional regulator [Proteus vulgaris]MDS0789118.1 helix-turn-helix transcriptional regulator [Proteus vulgaris]